MVEVRELSYGILKEVSFTLEKGRVLGIVGRNGSGKTTLLKCIGSYYSYGGSVKVGGREISEVSPRERFSLVNYLPQNFSYLFPYKVKEFLSITTGKREISQVLEKLQIEELEDRFINTLSGGEGVKVQLARLLLSNPKVFLLDEPVAFLDVTVYSLIGSIVSEVRNKGKTILITAHDLSFLHDVCDLFLGIEKGKVVFFGGKEVFIEGIGRVFGNSLVVEEVNGEVFIKPKGGGK